MVDQNGPPRDHSAEYESALVTGGEQNYLLRLYVAGLSPRSQAAISSIKSVCEEYLEGRYALEVIDIYRKPALAAGEQILAVPTLLKVFPAPLRKLIGDLSNREKVLFGLDLKQKEGG